MAGINTDIFTGHSIESAPSNSARNWRAHITDILAAAGWSSKRTFAKHYDKQISADNVIQESVLPWVHYPFLLLLGCVGIYIIENQKIFHKKLVLLVILSTQLVFSIKLWNLIEDLGTAEQYGNGIVPIKEDLP